MTERPQSTLHVVTEHGVVDVPQDVEAKGGAAVTRYVAAEVARREQPAVAAEPAAAEPTEEPAHGRRRRSDA